MATNNLINTRSLGVPSRYHVAPYPTSLSPLTPPVLSPFFLFLKSGSSKTRLDVWIADGVPCVWYPTGRQPKISPSIQTHLILHSIIDRSITSNLYFIVRELNSLERNNQISRACMHFLSLVFFLGKQKQFYKTRKWVHRERKREKNKRVHSLSLVTSRVKPPFIISLFFGRQFIISLNQIYQIG